MKFPVLLRCSVFVAFCDNDNDDVGDGIDELVHVITGKQFI